MISWKSLIQLWLLKKVGEKPSLLTWFILKKKVGGKDV
jgi:hypothetical protein